MIVFCLLQVPTLLIHHPASELGAQDESLPRLGCRAGGRGGGREAQLAGSEEGKRHMGAGRAARRVSRTCVDGVS